MYPFNIVDSASGLNEYDAWVADPTLPEPQQYATTHYFAMLNLFVDPPAGWKLVGCEAHVTKRNQIIAVLGDHTEAPGTSNDYTNRDSLQVNGSVIHVGDLFDDVLPILSSYHVGTPEAKPDPDEPGSLAVRHSYQINGKKYRVELRRREDAGPYRVFAIVEAK